MDLSNFAPSILSAPLILRQILLSDAKVSEIIDESIYQILAPTDTKLPYVAIYREALTAKEVKLNQPSRRALISVDCYHDDYLSSLMLAETVADALRNYNELPIAIFGQRIRQILLIDASESIDGDAVCQSLKFEVTI